MKRPGQSGQVLPARLAALKKQLNSPEEAMRLLATAMIEGGRNQQKRVSLFKNPAETVSMLEVLAKEPDNMLAAELSAPARALVAAIGDMVGEAHCVAAAGEKLQNAGIQERAALVLGQLEFALALIFRDLAPVVSALAHFSKNSDLLCGAIGHAVGDGSKAGKLIERYQELFPEDGKQEDGAFEDGWPAIFAWEAYNRMQALEAMADEFPEKLRSATREMNGWPMLRHRFVNSKKRFEELADKLQLGADYPLNTSEGAKFRPETPMVRYLDGLVWRFHVCGQSFREARQHAIRMKAPEPDAVAFAQRTWGGIGEPALEPEALAAIQASLDLPKLTKSTAKGWADKALVPYILAQDAKTAETCTEPALRMIWKQQGKTGTLKSRSDFKSRLAPDVSKQLRSMARPG
ncbi:MAG: hypothetical protein JWR69_4606 [Pedosphaera sp.]|nr:hypothetical protein [Pedosphaera sp.]